MPDDLFENVAESADETWYAVSNRPMLLQSLGAFALLPHCLIPDDGDRLSERCASRIPVVRHGLADATVKALSDESTGMFPILSELTSKLRPRPVEGLDPDRFGVIDGPVPLECVRRTMFPSRELLEDFRARVFDDVPLDAVPLSAEERLFSASDAPPLEELLSRFEATVGSSTESTTPARWRRSDKVAGATIAILRQLPGDEEWIAAASSLLQGKSDSSGRLPPCITRIPKWIMTGETGDELDEPESILLMTAVRCFGETDLSSGWVPSELLRSIHETARQHAWFADKGAEAAELDRWAAYSKEMLEDRGTVHPLTDEKFMVRRAVLLALLYEHVGAVENSADSFLRPGPRVRAMAALLAGIHSGFRSLSAELKRPRSLGMAIGALVCGLTRSSEEGIARFRPTIRREEIGPLRKRVSIEIDGEAIASCLIEAHPAIRQLRAVAERLGIALRDDGTGKGLKYTWEWPDGRRQPVHIRLLGADYRGKNVVRFSSPCRSLGSILRGKPSADAVAALLKSRSKEIAREQLIDLLLRNDFAEMHCRFSISPSEAAIMVSVDQIVETLDDEEFRAHLEHVARVADDFEKGLELDEFR